MSFTGYNWGERQNIIAPDGGFISVVPHLKNGQADDVVLVHIATTNNEWLRAKLKELKDALNRPPG